MNTIPAIGSTVEIISLHPRCSEQQQEKFIRKVAKVVATHGMKSCYKGEILVEGCDFYVTKWKEVNVTHKVKTTPKKRKRSKQITRTDFCKLLIRMQNYGNIDANVEATKLVKEYGLEKMHKKLTSN